MKVSYRWVRDLAPGLELAPAEAAELLAARGAPVEEVTDLGAGLGDLVVGQVLEVGPHPGADRLLLCQVLGAEGPVPVVCGAPNVQAGVYYPFAAVGAAIPGGLRVGRRKIRGVYSNGMLCSERELGLGEDHDGVMALSGEFIPGEPLVAALGLDDTRLDIEVTPNRGDLLSHIGIARELHPSGQSSLRLPRFAGDAGLDGVLTARASDRCVSAGVRVAIEDPQLCARYMAAVVRGVTVGPSPRWLADRLGAAGARPICNVVDATNYVMLEIGQPLHAFDLSALRGGSIAAGPARHGESIATLDGEVRSLREGMLVIRDSERPVAVGGVIGGMDTQVSASTVDILLECALFGPAGVRATRKGLGVSTDASYRFERGVDPTITETAIRRAAALVLAVAGGEIDGGIVDVNPSPWLAPTVALRPSRVGRVLGVGFVPAEISELLAPLGYGVEPGGADHLDVSVPGHRSYDTLREVDLIEEVARMRGYETFPDELSPFLPGTVPDHPLFRLEDAIRAALVAEGLSEAQTPALAPPEHGDVPLRNPMTREESFLRRDRLSGLLGHLERNLARGVRDVRLFEIGAAFRAAAGEGAAPRESARVTVAMTGRTAPLHWSGIAEAFDLFDAARVLELIGHEAYDRVRLLPAPIGSAPPAYLPDRCLALVVGEGDPVGWGGEIDPAALDLPRWAGVVVGAEVELPESPSLRPAVAVREVPAHPASERDFAFAFPADMPAGAVIDAARQAAGELLEALEVFDLYQGGDLPDGTRSLAIRLRFRSLERTLTEREVREACRRVLGRVKEETGVEPRG